MATVALGALQYEEIEAIVGIGFLMFGVGILFVGVVIVPVMIWSIRSWLKRLTESVERLELLVGREKSKPGDGPAA